MYFAGSDYFLQQIADSAAARGYTVYVSECNHFNETVFEHLLIPELKLAFLSSNRINALDIDTAIPINFMRFYEKTQLSAKKNRIDFSRKAADELKSEAVTSLNHAQKSYLALKSLYSKAADPEKMHTVCDGLLQEINAKYSESPHTGSL